MYLLKHPRLIIATMTVLSTLLIFTYAQRDNVSGMQPSLGIEIALSKAFYLPAAVDNKSISAVIRIPNWEPTGTQQEAPSAVKIVPRMKGRRVEVRVFALFGEPTRVESCKEWSSLKSKAVASYEADLGDNIEISELSELGIRFGEKPLTFLVVAKKNFSLMPGPNEGYDELNSCGCASCGGLQCCPNRGYCISCGACGPVCCDRQLYLEDSIE